ncbi:MAG: tRNA (N6-threonylcarbamoyladenosine(37)-N6)-methyltransferase TrmO [Desulfococcaceae bacterium]
MTIEMKPIGVVRTAEQQIPRHWTVSSAEGVLDIDPVFEPGLTDIQEGQRIVVLFHFHQSPAFTPEYLRRTPPHRSEEKGVFSICSPVRPNPIGLSVLEVLSRQGGQIQVRGIDMIHGTPILDIKPWITGETDCPSGEQKG